MSKYNMIKGGSLLANTASGTGTKSLTSIELSYLIDDNLSTGGVTISNSDILYLDIDLGYRLRIDTILLYADDLLSLSNINFYYKNDEADSYTICSKSSSVMSYIGTVPSPSAPRYIRCTVSGVALQIYEIQVLNDDNIIAFGSDGSLTDTSLDDAPAGEYGEVQAIEVFNNTSGDIPANAYVCVDYTGQPGDAYVDISENIDGPFYNIMDGDIIKTLWSRGTHNNTKVSNTSDGAVLVISKPTPYENLEPDYIGVLPDVTCTYPTKPAGFRQYFAFDKINNKVYLAFWPGTTNTGSSIVLWCYDVISNTWAYRGTLVSTLWDATTFTMCTDGSYVYFMAVPTAVSSTTRTITRHNVSGAIGNLSVFTTFTAAYSTVFYYFMICDFNGNIWIKNNYVYQKSTAKYWYRLNISTQVTTLMNSNYYGVESTNAYCVLAYDSVRNRIYNIMTNSVSAAYTNNYYMEMYDVATDTWTQQYFSYGTRIMANNTDLHMSCYNEAVYFQSASYGGKIYKYDLTTGLVTIMPVNVLTKTGIMNKIIAFAPIGPDDVVSLLVFSGNTNEYSFFGYNLPQVLNNNVPNLLHISGTYTSTILALPDMHKASYFRVDSTSTVGLTNVSKTKSYQDGTIEVRSSNVSPLPVNIVFWPLRSLTATGNYRLSLDNNTLGTSTVSIPLGSGSSIGLFSHCVSRRTCKQLIVFAVYGTYDYSYAYLSDFEGNAIYTKQDYYNSSKAYVFGNTKHTQFDYNDGFWCYDDFTYTLRHYNNQGVLVSSKIAQGVIGLAVNLTSTGTWYLSSLSKAAVHIDNLGDTFATVALGSPIHICSADENGCWVIDFADVEYSKVISRYDADGSLVLTIPITRTFKTLSKDLLGGFYALSYDNEQFVSHYDKDGNLTMEVGGLSTNDHISGGPFGVLVYSTTLKRMKYISLATKAVVWTKFYTDFYATSSYMDTFLPKLASMRIEDQQADSVAPTLIPRTYDSFWSSGAGSLAWKEVDKDGYFLTKSKYHQVRLTLWNFDGVSTPVIKRVVMAPAIEIKDIKPNESKPFYIRSNIPAGFGDVSIDTRIKVWWDVTSS